MNPRNVHLVLVGGGHAHIEVLRRWAMAEALPKVKLTLVSSGNETFYSGMLPGFVAGQYQRDQLRLLLDPLAKKAGATFLQESCLGIDAIKQEVTLSKSGQVFYDYVSFDVGSLSQMMPGFDENNWRMIATRPFPVLLEKLGRWKQEFKQPDISVVGGGAAGFELCLALKNAHPQWKIRLLTQSGLKKLWEKELDEQGIETRVFSVKRLEGRADFVEIIGQGLVLKADGVLLATGARGVPIFKDAELGDYLEVTASLNSPIFSNIFGAGDCIHFRPTNGLPKAGVFPVREAPILFENLYRSVQGFYDWKKYRPQKLFLRLLNTGNGRAILEYGPLQVRGAWAWKLKNRIDLGFMRKYC